MTKKSISRLLQASLMCCLAVLFTACDDIFAGEDNPIPAYLSMSDKPVTIKVGDTYRRKAISVTTAVVEYSSSKTDVATVNNEGLVTAKAEGTTTITATATGYSSQNGKKIYQPASVSYVVTVTPATVYATNLSIDATLRLDNVAQTLTPTVTPSDATIIWTSSDEAVATVDAKGKVTPVAKGKATITATSGDLSATSTVYVYDKIWNINTDGAAAVGADKSWLIEGTGTAVDNAIYIGTDATVTLNGINITQQIDCSGNATIILADGSTNTVTVTTDQKAGIKIGGTGTLTINGETAGTGILNATGGNDAAGIGTSRDETGGNIVINGGKVTATGGDHAAGIGTGNADMNNNECGSITINGGTVTAIGVNGAAGIGTGVANYGTNTCGAITINGGTVTATGGGNGAGIGTGWSFNAKNECGAITIDTGVTSVTAKKGTSSPNSIGTGTDNATQICGTITFGTAAVFNGSAWSPTTMVAGTYGGLNLAISTTTNANDTWTLTPAP
jgi:hypothetical protein